MKSIRTGGRSAGSARRRQAAVRQARRAWRGDEAPLTPADPVAPAPALSSSQHQRQQRPHRLFPAYNRDLIPELGTRPPDNYASAKASTPSLALTNINLIQAQALQLLDAMLSK